MELSGARSLADSFVRFLNEAVTPFHVVSTARKLLSNAGYIELTETEEWDINQELGKFFVCRNDTSLIAFTVSKECDLSKGAKIVGAHTDSPNLALKPHTFVSGKEYCRVGVQCYGGGLWHTWFDRDLTVAGRVIVDESSVNTEIKHEGKLTSKLIHIQKPILRIPNLAIHLLKPNERNAFTINKESNLIPIAATTFADKNQSNTLSFPSTIKEKMETYSKCLFELIARAAECKVDDIVDFDLSVIDTQPACIGGVHDEFVYGPRLDNLISCFCALKALISSGLQTTNDAVKMVCLFDHEEIGSTSAQGANSSFLVDIIERLLHGKCTKPVFAANSFLLSVDGAHAFNPNYKDRYEDAHQPLMHHGPVIKYNANMRYATNGFTAATIKKIANERKIPLQEFVVKNDSPCGSTIGPILSALSGIKTADIGNPMLSMHSIRETCGTLDLCYLITLLEGFFEA